MIMTGRAKVRILAGITKVPNRAGIPITANELNMFEPSMLPTAISEFPFLAALSDTITSGRDVPSATALTAIISYFTVRISASSITDSIVNFAPR